ncbi:MAG TPA: AMP-binding protein, partial [Polyangiaceae bacterium]
NLGAILKSADARALVVSPRVLKVLQTQGADLPIPPVVLTDADLLGAPTGDAPLPEIDGTDTALIQYTSGTTGQPKGVVIPHAALVSNAFAIAKGLHITPSDVGVSWLPLFHDMGLIGVLLTAVAHPYALHLAGPEYFAMGAERWMRLASKVRATITAAPNFAYEHCAKRANKLDGERLESLRLALNGAEPVHAATVRRFATALEQNGLSPTVSLPVYGMAECTLAVSFAEPGALHTMSVDRARLEHDGVVIAASGDDAREVVSVGAPVAGTSVRVADETGRTLPSGRVGVLRVAGTSVMNGYFRNDDASARALADGWLDTGDLGFIADGRVYVTGRAKDLIIQGGRNVYPYDLERIATEAGDLRAGGVVAFGRTGADSGTESIVLVAESSEKDPAKREALVRELRGAILATLGVKVEDIHLVPLGAVPRTTSGKARRRECARLLETGVIG